MSTLPWRSSTLLLLLLLGGGALLSAVAADDGASQPTVIPAASNGSSTSANRALDPVYHVKNLFIEQLYRSIRVSPIVDVTQEPGNYDVWPTIQRILAAVASLAACIIIGILFCIIMPITGLCCCCCRVCGKCDGKPPTMDPPRAKCKRVSCGFSLLALTTLLLGAAVVTFLSTEEIYKQLQTDDGSALSRYNPTMGAFLDTVDATMQKPAEAVRKINQSFGGILDTSEGRIFSALSGVPPDFVPVTLAALSKSNGSIFNILAELDMLKNAQANVSLLNLGSCCIDGSNCTIAPNANYTTFDVATLRSSSAIANAADALLKANDSYAKLHEGIAKSINSAKTATASTVNKQQTDLEHFTKGFVDVVEDLRSASLPSSVQRTIADYSKYVRIGGFALGSIVALVVLLLYLGLCCGLCCRRAGDDSSSCNKGSGAKSLLAAVGFMFMFSWLLMLVTMILFPAGSLQLVCWLFDGSLDSKFESMNEVRNTTINLGSMNTTVGIVESTFRDCRTKSLLNIVETYAPEVSQIVTNLTDKGNWNVDLSSSIGSVTVQLPSDINSTISSLTSANSSLHGLLNAIDQLQALVVQDPFIPDPSLVLANISNSTTQCRTDKAQLEAQAAAADASQTQLQQLTNVRQLLDNVIQSIAAARAGITGLQRNVSENDAVTLPTKVLDDIVSNLTTVINQTVQQLTDYPCRPLYNSAQNVVDLVCSAVLDPVDALWFSLGWATALFVPVIILSLCLVSLYRREEPYKSHKDGRDYQGYEDEGVTIRDNVPLDNMPSRKSQYPYNESYLNAAYNGPHDDGRGDGSVPPPYYGMYTGGGASNGGHFPRVVHSPTNGDVTFGGPGPRAPMSQKRY